MCVMMRWEGNKRKEKIRVRMIATRSRSPFMYLNNKRDDPTQEGSHAVA